MREFFKHIQFAMPEYVVDNNYQLIPQEQKVLSHSVKQFAELFNAPGSVIAVHTNG